MLPNNNDYKDLIEDIKNKVRQAQYRAVVKANAEMIELNWEDAERTSQIWQLIH